MKIIYPRVCGIDVHKKFIVAVICISEPVEPIYLKKDKAVKLLVEMAKYFNDITIDSDAFDVEDVIITVSYDGTVIVEIAEINNNYKESCAIITLIDEDCKTSLLKFHQDNLENISIFSMDEDQEY